MKTRMILTMVIAATTATMTAQVATVEMGMQPKVLMRVAAVVKSVKALMMMTVATTATMAAQIPMGIQHNGADGRILKAAGFESDCLKMRPCLYVSKSSSVFRIG